MKSDVRDQSYAQKTNQILPIVFLQNRPPMTDPPSTSHFPFSYFFPKTENPENQPVSSYNPVELRKPKSNEKIANY